MSGLKSESDKIDALLMNKYNEWKQRADQIEQDIARQNVILASDAAKGDRSENAVFQIATDTKQRLLLARKDINERLEDYEQYNEEYVQMDYIAIGTTCRIRTGNEEFVVKIVPSKLGAAKIGAISISGPVGRALLNKKAGDEITVKTRIGPSTYKILEIY